MASPFFKARCYNPPSMLDGLTLVPAAALAVAAWICFRPPAWLAPRRTYAVLSVVLLALFAATMMAVALLRSAPVLWQLPLSPWSSAVFQEDPALAVDAIAAIAIVLTCLGALITVLVPLTSRRGVDALGGSLLVAAASALFVAAARNPLGLVSAWLLLDIALFVGARTRRRALLASHLGLLLVLVALVDLPAAVPTVDPELLSRWARFCLIAAATVRMGLYPFWWPVPRSSANSLWQACSLRLGPTVAGASLVLAVSHSPQDLAEAGALALLPGMVAILFGALLTWLAGDAPSRLDWSTVCYAGLLVLAASLGTATGAAIALLLLVDLVIGRCVQYGSQGLAASRPARIASALAVLSMAGMPPSLGFISRWLLYRELLFHGRVGLLILLVAAAGLVIARWRDMQPRTGLPSVAGHRLAVGLAGLACVPWLLGLGFQWLRPSLTSVTGAPAASFWSDQSVLIAGAILLPILVGTSVPWLRGGSLPSRAENQRAMAQVLRLTDIFDGLRSASIRAGRWLHDSLGFTEGERAMAWTLLAAVAIGAAMLDIPPANDSTQSIAPQALAALAVAIMVSTTMLVGGTPFATLAALVGGYGLATFVLLSTSTGGPAAVAAVITIKGVSGLVVVAILVISVLQAPADRNLAGAAHRLQRPSPAAASRESRLLPLLALATAVVVVNGIPSVTLPVALPQPLLHVALVMIAGGALTVVFARTPLRLTGGVLLALTGFELVYAQIEPGLLISGGLAVFQLAFAIVAAAYVGVESPVGGQG